MRTFPPKRTFALLRAILGRVQTFHVVAEKRTIFGVDRILARDKELRAVNFLDLTHEDYREANWALITELLDGKRRQFQIEKKYRRKDGSLIWVSNNVSLVPGTERVPRGLRHYGCLSWRGWTRLRDKDSHEHGPYSNDP
jgi:PAS domain S-box-containing protein